MVCVSTADIVFVLKDKPHPLFERKGNDLIYKPEIPLVIVSAWLLLKVSIRSLLYDITIQMCCLLEETSAQ